MEAVNDRRQKPCRRKEREGVVWSLLQRETGSRVDCKPTLSFSYLWSSVRMKHWTLERQSSNHFHQGDNAIFTIGFESTGSYLVALSASGKVCLLDPRQGWGAHSEPRCVAELHGHTAPANVFNQVREHMLITASDDTTIRLWDLRKLGSFSSTCSSSASADRGNEHPAFVDDFRGHTYWVKNLEPLPGSSSLFLSSGFDGTVRIWDVDRDGSKQHTDFTRGSEDDGGRSNVVLQHPHILRMALVKGAASTPNSSKLVLSFRKGGVAIVHAPSLSSCAEALRLRAPSVGQLVSTESISKLLRLCQPTISGPRGVRRKRDYVVIPKECFSQTSRLELLQGSGEQWTLSLRVDESGGGPPMLLARCNVDEERDRLVLYNMQDLKQPTPAPLPGHLRVSRYEASGAHFPHRLVASIDDSPSSEIMHDAAVSNSWNLICSPYYRGCRLLRIEPGITSHASGDKVELVPSGHRFTNTHRAPVVTADFHPHAPCFAVGGLDGKVTFHLPRL